MALARRSLTALPMLMLVIGVLDPNEEKAEAATAKIGTHR
jgi:hypothetical protein